jgi:hypothetical protein
MGSRWWQRPRALEVGDDAGRRPRAVARHPGGGGGIEEVVPWRSRRPRGRWQRPRGGGRVELRVGRRQGWEATTPGNEGARWHGADGDVMIGGIGVGERGRRRQGRRAVA